MDKNDVGFIGGCLTLIVVVALQLFIPPLIVRHAWDLIAVQRFSLPAFTYWEVFWASLAIQLLFKSSTYSREKK